MPRVFTWILLEDAFFVGNLSRCEDEVLIIGDSSKFWLSVICLLLEPREAILSIRRIFFNSIIYLI